MFLLGNFVLHCGAPLVRDVHVLSVFLRFRLDRRLDEIPAMISLHVTDLRPQLFVLSLIDLVDTPHVQFRSLFEHFDKALPKFFISPKNPFFDLFEDYFTIQCNLYHFLQRNIQVSISRIILFPLIRGFHLRILFLNTFSVRLDTHTSTKRRNSDVIEFHER